MKVGFLIISVGKKLHKICLEDIMHVEEKKSGLQILLKNSKKLYTKMNLENLLMGLPEDMLTRISNTELVPGKNIEAVINNKVFVAGRSFLLAEAFEQNVVDAFRERVETEYQECLLIAREENFVRTTAG